MASPSAFADRITLASVEATLIELAHGAIGASGGPRRGRPPILPAAILWASVAIGVLRGAMSQAAIWRVVRDAELWRGAQANVSDEAVYRRLATTDDTVLATLFRTLSAQLARRVEPWAATTLAPWATEVVAIDETTLDPVARSLPSLRGVPAGADTLLPGTLAGCFDLRRQQWRAITMIPDPHQNEKVAARELVAALPAGSLVLADLGYFGFAWFDTLTDQGLLWISRLRAKTSYRVEHVLLDDGLVYDALVWLGAHRANRAKHLVRLIRFRTGAIERSYLTNVRSPLFLGPATITALYARRWDIELAVNLVKTHLGLHLLWSAKTAVIRQQIWAVLIIAQIIQALRVEVAGRAKIDLFDVSLELLIRYLPQYAAQYEDPIAAYIAHGHDLHFFRPSRRVTTTAPPYPKATVRFPPDDLVTTQVPRYDHRNCGPRSRRTEN